MIKLRATIECSARDCRATTQTDIELSDLTVVFEGNMSRGVQASLDISEFIRLPDGWTIGNVFRRDKDLSKLPRERHSDLLRSYGLLGTNWDDGNDEHVCPACTEAILAKRPAPKSSL